MKKKSELAEVEKTGFRWDSFMAVFAITVIIIGMIFGCIVLFYESFYRVAPTENLYQIIFA